MVYCFDLFCSPPRRRYKWVLHATTILRNIFDCEIGSLPVDVLRTFPFFNDVFTHYKGITGCFPLNSTQQHGNMSAGAASDRASALWSKCIFTLQTKCRNSKVRLIKSLRISFALVKEIIAQIKDVKIIHLFRDPRAVIHSRRVIGQGITNTRHLCDRMARDIDMARLLRSVLPDRVYPLRYECLAQRTDSVLRKLYSDLLLHYGVQTDRWIATYTNSSAEINQHGYGVFKFKSSGKYSGWRLKIRFLIVNGIDRVCTEVYERIGVRPFNNRSELTDFNINEMYITPYTARYCT